MDAREQELLEEYCGGSGSDNEKEATHTLLDVQVHIIVHEHLLFERVSGDVIEESR